MRAGSVTDHRYRVLDAWRGIAACLVTVVHIPVAHGLQGTALLTSLQLFVDFFFVLSGFVIFHAYGARIGDGRKATGFMIRRLGRVWPLHAAVIGGFVALEILKLAIESGAHLPLDGAPFAGNRSPETLISNLLLTQAFNLHGMTSWNGPAWSIGVEFYTYALFALAVVLCGARASVFAGLSAAGLIGVVALSDSWLFTTHSFGFFRCLYGFFAGVLVAMAVARAGADQRTMGRLEAPAVVLLAGFILLTGVDASSLLAPVVFAMAIYVFAFEAGAISALLRQGWAQALGLWSYSIYMVHMLLFAVLKIVFTFLSKAAPAIGLSAPIVSPVKLWTLGSPLLDAALVAGELALVMVLARFTYGRIEAPARAWFNARARGYEESRGATGFRLVFSRGARA
jgi:peptidoglycan/LPS O-acetylase OafA/YrhL